MKRTLCAVMAIVMLAIMITPTLATVWFEQIEINGVTINCDGSDDGYLQIFPTDSQFEEMLANRGNGFYIDLSGRKTKVMNGYSIYFPDVDSYGLTTIKFADKTMVKLPQLLSYQMDHANGIKVSYDFDKDGVAISVSIETFQKDGSTEGYGNYNDPILVSLPYENANPNENGSVVLENVETGIISRSFLADNTLYGFVYQSGKHVIRKSSPLTYTDVIPAWAKDGVDYLSARGILCGYTDGGLYANNGITQLEFAIMFSRMYGYDTSEDSYFDSYFPNLPEWSKKAFDKGTAYIMFLQGNDKFEPNKVMTRGEVFNALYIFIMVHDLYYNPDKYESTFSDYTEDLYSVKMLDQMGLIDGYGGNVNVNDVASRAQVLTLLERFIKWQIAYSLEKTVYVFEG